VPDAPSWRSAVGRFKRAEGGSEEILTAEQCVVAHRVRAKRGPMTGG